MASSLDATGVEEKEEGSMSPHLIVLTSAEFRASGRAMELP
jgi:hypothetical protein